MTKTKSRLGRGLSSLLSVPPADPPVTSPSAGSHGEDSGGMASRTAAADEVDHSNQIREIPLSAVSANPYQPRREFDEESLHALANSLRTSGLIQPVIVRATDSGYQLIAGERRWRAAKLAHLQVVPAIVRQADETQQAELALVENIHRQDLNPVERAEAYRSLMASRGLSQSELADRLGEERSGIAHHLRLLELGPSVIEHVRAGRLSLGHAKLLAGVAEHGRQTELANRAVMQGLSVRALEKLVKAPVTSPAPSAAPASNHLRDLEKTISSQLQLRVRLRSSKKGGSGALVIRYASLEDFDRLVSRLGVALE